MKINKILPTLYCCENVMLDGSTTLEMDELIFFSLNQRLKAWLRIDVRVNFVGNKTLFLKLMGCEK